MMMKVYFSAAILVAVVTSSMAGHAVCPQNYNVARSGSPNNEYGNYLNAASPIQCNGIVVAWRYCFFPPSTIRNNKYYAASFAVYTWRNWYYDHRQESHIVVNKTGSQLPPGFTCETLRLNNSQRFLVSEGDIIGVCLFGRQGGGDEGESGSSQKPLDVVGGAYGGDMLEFVSTSCMGVFGSYDILSLSTESVSSSLHVAVEIEPHDLLHDTVSPSTSYQSVEHSVPLQSPVMSSFATTSILEVTSSFAATTSATPILEVTSSLEVATTNAPRPTSPSPMSPSGTSVAEMDVSPETSPSNVVIPVNTTSLYSVVVSNSRDEEDSQLGIGPIIAMALASTLVLIAAFMCAFVLIAVRLRRQKKLPKQHPHRHIGLDHFVIVSDTALEPRPYEQPVSAAHTVVCNPSAHYEMDVAFSSFNLPTETDNEYHHLHQTVNVQPLKLSRYSVLCEHYYKVLEQAVLNDSPCDPDPYLEPAKTEEDLYVQLKEQNLKRIPQQEIEVTSHLGSGQFGRVRKGVWKSSGEIHGIALKTLGSQSESRVKLLQEAAIMGQFFHPNVITLLGVVISEPHMMLVMELASMGDLQGHLVSMNPDPGQLIPMDTPEVLLCYSQQIAFGMQYLAGKRFVHRDLAARNVLLTEGNICKIADFGMTRDLANENYYMSHGGKIPVKWTAPEAVYYGKFSTASDAWSYGCLLYEIWSLGKDPYGGCSNRETLEKLGTGYRLPPPPGCPRVIYEIMILCWHPEPSSRPKFRDLLLQLIEPENEVLKIPEDAMSTHRLAGMLGGFLEAGLEMYRDLQDVYRTSEAAK